MPTWLLILIVVVAVVPGAVVVLAGVAAMFFAPADYDRRRKRLAQGLCVHCGYDVRSGPGATDASARCPECGEPPFVSPEPIKVDAESAAPIREAGAQ